VAVVLGFLPLGGGVLLQLQPFGVVLRLVLGRALGLGGGLVLLLGEALCVAGLALLAVGLFAGRGLVGVGHFAGPVVLLQRVGQARLDLWQLVAHQAV